MKTKLTNEKSEYLKHLTGMFFSGIWIKSDSESGTGHSCGYDFCDINFETYSCCVENNLESSMKKSLFDLWKGIDCFTVENPERMPWITEERFNNAFEEYMKVKNETPKR